MSLGTVVVGVVMGVNKGIVVDVVVVEVVNTVMYFTVTHTPVLASETVNLFPGQLLVRRVM